MQLSALQWLPAMIPHTEMTLLTPFPEIDQTTYPDTRLFRSSRRQPLLALTLLLRAFLWRLFKHGLRIYLPKLLHHPELLKFQQADLVVDLSGDTLTEDYGLQCFMSHLVPILIGIFLDRPVFLCAQTLGPYRLTKPFARFVLNRVAMISVREELTLNDLRELGIRNPPVHLTADLAFILTLVPATRVDEILVHEGIFKGDGPLVGLTPSRLLGHRFNPQDPRQFEDLMANVANYLIEQKGATVVLLSHVMGPGVDRDDRIVAGRIFDQIRNQAKVRVVKGDYRPEELKGLIGRYDMCLGLRMHANIAALSMCVPTLAIAYSRKTYGIMDMVGQGDWVCDITHLSSKKLTEKIDRLWDQRETVRRELSRRMEEIQQKAKRNIQLAGSLVESDDIHHGHRES